MTTRLSSKPAPGDFALHKSGLDGRRVTKVSEDGKSIWLDIHGTEYGPYPARNYSFAAGRQEASA